MPDAMPAVMPDVMHVPNSIPDVRSHVCHERCMNIAQSGKCKNILANRNLVEIYRL
jgi:hypothetical protein